MKNLLTLTGLLTVATIGFLYLQGQQVTRIFDDKFITFLGQFVENVLKQDVPSALVVKVRLEKGVTLEQAIQSMIKYAEQLQVKLIHRYPLHPDIQKITGKPFRFVELFEFYDAAITATLLNYNPDFATYFPCRIILYEDQKGQAWLATINLNLLVYGTQSMNMEIKLQALKLRDNLLKIMEAAASGV